ncbi:MAG TPA: glycosyltransferase family 2 protein [Saprospiraceae bacterium]|nr:glycosyltransferase family 2 protein [Saprospiraceae bacterium]
MQVSVIIPVYNAASFVETAVASVLSQPEAIEVLLIEDGSRDGSYEICQRLASDPRVRLMNHPGRANYGVASSRNLGIRNTTMPFIAFLDADDTYENGRFEVTKRVFEKHPDADGVHEMIGVHYHDPGLRSQLPDRSHFENTNITIPAPPDDLFRILARGKHGHIHLNALTLKRSALDPEDLMDTSLVMSEDSDFILRFAATHKLYGGDLSRIVAKRGVHGRNSVLTNPHVMEYRKRYLQKCIDHNFYGSKDLIAQCYILTRRVGAGRFFAPFRRLGKFAMPAKFVGIAGYLIIRPGLLLNLTKLALSQVVKSIRSA